MILQGNAEEGVADRGEAPTLGRGQRALRGRRRRGKAGFNVDELFVVKRAFVDGGPIMKRFRPRSMGRANRIRKRTSHLTIVVGLSKRAQGAAA